MLLYVNECVRLEGWRSIAGQNTNLGSHYSQPTTTNAQSDVSASVAGGWPYIEEVRVRVQASTRVITECCFGPPEHARGRGVSGR